MTKSGLLFIIILILFISCSNKPQSQNRNILVSTIDTMLIPLKTTNRISSNHYSDIVMDKHGNSYISCFFMKENQKDYILILKVNSKGIVEWEMGTESIGRATAIAINSKNKIYVTGYFTDKLILGDKSVKTDGNKMFVAEISPNGTCDKIIINQGNAMPFDISISNDGFILIGGVFEEKVSFSDIYLKEKGEQSGGFLALFNSSQQCTWIKRFDGKISRIKSKNNNFYITGGFNESIHFNKDTLSTSSNYDNDGFLLALNIRDASSHLVKFGTEGIIKKGYRTKEKGCDITFNSKGDVVVAAIINKSKLFNQNDCRLITFSSSLETLSEITALNGIDNSGVLTLVKDDNEDYWLTGFIYKESDLNDKSNPTPKNSHSFILQLNQKFKIENSIYPKHNINMGFRSSYYNNERIIFSGHFNDSLSIGNNSISSKGKHDLFIYTFLISTK